MAKLREASTSRRHANPPFSNHHKEQSDSTSLVAKCTRSSVRHHQTLLHHQSHHHLRSATTVNGHQLPWHHGLITLSHPYDDTTDRLQTRDPIQPPSPYLFALDPLHNRCSNPRLWSPRLHRTRCNLQGRLDPLMSTMNPYGEPNRVDGR